MNKEELLQELSIKISKGEISREEIATRFSFAPTAKTATINEKAKISTPFSVTKILYILGAVIVVIGISIFISQIWYGIGSFGRMAVTLGLGLLIAAIGSMLLKSKPDESIGTVFHFIGGILIPGGAVITLSELNIDFVSLWHIAIIFGVIFAFYLLLNSVHKKPTLTFFAIANGTAFVYLLVEAIISGSFYGYDDLHTHLIMIIGASYLLLAHAFRDGWNKKLVGVLCFFGITGFLGATFSQVVDSVPWQILYFIIVAGGFALSAYMKRRSILVISTLFLIAHVSYITGEYFSDSLGWSISLVLLGFIFIGLGYISVNINKKYIAS